MAGTRVLDQEYPEVTPSGAPGNDYERIESNPAMFGGLIGQAEEKLGQGAEQASSQGFALADFYGKITADDRTNQFNKAQMNRFYGDPSDPSKPGLFSLRGADAMSAWPRVQKENEEDRIRFSQGLSDSARLQYENDTRRSAMIMSEAGGRHVDKQFDTYSTATQNSREDNAIRMIGTQYNDDAAYKSSLIDGMSAVATRARVAGVNPDTPEGKAILDDQLAQFHAKAVTARVEGLQNDSPYKAWDFLQDSFQDGDIDSKTYDALLTRLRQPMAAAAGEAGVATAPRVTTSRNGAPSAGSMVFGDSLGVGVKSAYNLDGDAVVGRKPGDVLDVIHNYKGDLTGKPIVLSSGASNDPTNVGLAQDQINELIKHGAKPSDITLLGVGDRKDLGGVNPSLEAIANKAGVKFQPIDPGNLSTDRVHPANYQKVFGGAHGDISGGPAANIDKSIPSEGRALLATIGGPEAGGKYNVRYGGATFEGYADHPRIREPIATGPNAGKTSDAAGRYQFLGSTWDEAKKALGLPDFSPASQDRAAWWLAQRDYRKATGGDLLTDLRSGDPTKLDRVARALHSTWTSLPGGVEEGVTIGKFAATYNAALQGKETSSIASREPSGGSAPTSNAAPGVAPEATPAPPLTSTPPPEPAAAPASPDDTFGLPDKAAALQIAKEMGGGDPIQQRMNMAEVNRRYSELMAVTYAQRYQLEHDIPNLVAAASSGVDVTLPESEIRQAFPKTKADNIVQNFKRAQQVGQVLKGAEFASPQELARMQGDLSSGQGVLSDVIHPSRRGASTGPGTVSSGIQDDPEEFKIRAAASQRLQQEIQKRDAILYGPEADPAAYAAMNPAVKPLIGAIDPKDPATFEKYASTTFAIQKYLGVPDGVQHVLTRGQAMNLSDQIEKSEDPKSTFQALQQQFGAAWPQVFHDAVSLGKLPAGYQAVMALDDPHDAALLSRTLASEKPGPDGKPGKAVDDVVDTIAASKGESGRLRDLVRYDPSVAAYASSIKRSGASDEQVEGIVNAVQTLALAKRAGGDASSAQLASAAAIKSFFGKFEYMPNGGARVPAAKFDAVSGNAADTLSKLTADNVAVPANFGQTGQADKQEYLNVLKASPTWITSPRSDALWLVDRGGRLVRTTQGNLVEIKFDAPSPVSSSPARNVEPQPNVYPGGL